MQLPRNAVRNLALKTQRSIELFERAQSVFPGGVTRSTIELDPHPIFVSYGQGAYVTDIDGHRMLDLNNNFTTLIHGHAFPPITEAVADLLRVGSCFANPMTHEIDLAELLIDRIPAVEHLRFVVSGTEAVMFAIKAARAATGRVAIARVEGAYHGAYDWAEAGQSASQTTPRGAYLGTPESVLDDVVVIQFNNVQNLEQQVSKHSERLAAILIDPMPSRAGLIPPTPEFMKAVNAVGKRYGIVIIADEVLNLRQGHAGASARYGLEPDLVTMGKIIGGGFPVGAIGGRMEIMSVFGKTGGKPVVPQGGTFSANPVSMLAGRLAMEALNEDTFEHLERLGNFVREGLSSRIAHHGADMCVTGAASLFRIHARASEPSSFRESLPTSAGENALKMLSRHFLSNGILMPCGAAASISTPMTEEDMSNIISVFDDFLVNFKTHAGEAA
ncbi:aspartate aminotransferase family protein [Agrobacterium cavarae]|uniref:aspartate aminotransferase family protein n=1 Tax=Agrobacterium cavarae TaxID=2528239 RepID=UPI0028A136A8|nr:aspartate aminotransferase family protein [Agrobacterium cavarae]